MDEKKLKEMKKMFLKELKVPVTSEQLERLAYWEKMREYLAIPLKEIADDVGIGQATLLRYVRHKIDNKNVEELPPRYRYKLADVNIAYVNRIFNKLTKLARMLYGKK